MTGRAYIQPAIHYQIHTHMRDHLASTGAPVYMRLIALVVLWMSLGPTAFAQGHDGLRLEGFLRTYFGVRIHDDLDFIAARNRARLNLTYAYERGRIFISNDLQNNFLDRGTALGENGVGSIRYDLHEAYLDMYWPQADLRLGRQQIVWGEADGAFITDQLNAFDLSEFLTQSFEDIRQGVPAARLTIYPGDLALTAVLIPSAFPSQLPAPDSPWNPVGEVFMELPITYEPARLPRFSLTNAEVAFRAMYYGVPLTTISVVLIDGWDRLPAIEKNLIITMVDARLIATAATVTPAYYRRQVVGGTVSTAALEPFVLRSEMAVHSRRALDMDASPPPSYLDPTIPRDPEREEAFNRAHNRGFVEYSPALLVMFGAERTFGRHLVRMQSISDLVLDDSEALSRNQYVHSVTALWNARYLRDTLTLRAFAYYTVGEDMWLNPSVTYNVSDALNASVGMHLFRAFASSDAIPSAFSFGAFSRNDFVFVSVQYGF